MVLSEKTEVQIKIKFEAKIADTASGKASQSNFTNDTTVPRLLNIST